MQDYSPIQKHSPLIGEKRAFELTGLFLDELKSLLRPESSHLKLAKIENLEALCGRWYVYYHRPFFFQRGATSVTIEVEKVSEYTLNIFFIFNDKNQSNRLKSYRFDVFKFTDSNASWKMDTSSLSFIEKRMAMMAATDFVIPFFDQDTQNFILSTSNQKNYWVLGRYPSLKKGEQKRLLAQLESFGFEIQNLITS